MAKDISCAVLKVIDEVELNGGKKVRVRIVSWNKRTPMLEKREFWYDDDGEEKMGKAKGLTLDDLEKIKENWDEIEKLMDK